ncbi:MAG TPA: putative sulfate exporter family transporter [Opitutaceae bacterium]|nr:putative sulfate exporter family transporter [Opitutaceae bacterium]
MSTRKALLSRIMETAARRLRCDKGTLYLFDEKARQLWTVVLQNDAIGEIRIEPPQGLAGYSFWHKEVVNVEDAYASPYFSDKTDKQTGYRTRAVLCMPVLDKTGHAIGVAQMINKLDGTPFDAADIEAMSGVVRDIGKLLDNSDTLPALAPGLALACIVALLGSGAHLILPKALQAAVSPVLFIILLGVGVANFLILPLRYLPGIRFAMRQLLRFAIVLLGARIAIADVANVGSQSLLVILALMLLAGTVALSIGKLLRISPKLSLMIAVGTAVCGGTAIAAIAPVIKARDEEFSFAVSVNMVMGMLAVLCFPLIGHALGWDDRFFGMWAGTAVNDTAQVLATGYAYSLAAGQTATIIKLVRNSLMVFVVVGAGFYYRGLEADAGPGAKKTSFMGHVKQSVPGFVLGFLFLATLNSLGFLSWLAAATRLDVPAALALVTNDVVLVAMAGIGLGTSLAHVRDVGLRPFLVSLSTFVAIAVASALLIRLIT